MKVFLILAISALVYSQIAAGQTVTPPPAIPQPFTPQDPCSTNYSDEPTDGFSQNVRLDEKDEKSSKLLKPGVAYLKERGITSDTYVNDYTGSLGDPGALFQEVNFSSYDLISANATFSDKNNVQKLVVAPFKIISAGNNIILNQLRINIAVKGDITTLGLGVGYDSSDPRRKAVQDKRQAVFKAGVFYIPECYTDKINQETAKQKNRREANRLLVEYNTLRTKHVFKSTLGYNAQVFSILSSSGTNTTVNNTNYYALKSHTYSLSASYGYNNSNILLTGGYNYILSRKSAEKDMQLLQYNGIQAGVNFRIFSFLSPEKLKENENYLKTFFVPALHIGLLYEYKGTGETDNVTFLENGLKSSNVFTPFLDILISPAAQFRIGFPYTKNKGLLTGTEDVSQFGTVLQYAFKIVNLN